MKMQLYSGVGKIYEKCQKIKPKTKQQRQKMYASCEISGSQIKGDGVKKFSPFNTISRESRDSYLLRVTNEPNTQTNYELSQNTTIVRERRATIDRSKFKRIIGPVNDRDYSVEVKADRDHRCTNSFNPSPRSKPLTVRQTHKWRKTLENLDFKKQINPERCNPHDYLKSMKSTQDSFLLQTLGETTESNFNNFKRFSFTPHTRKAHNFKSDSKHELMKKIYEREIEPEYDITTNNEEFFRKSMRSPKGEMRIQLNRDKIVTRVDRSDPSWLQTLEYDGQIIHEKVPDQIKTIDFDLCNSRKMNEVHSKYPIRQSLKQHIPLNKLY